MIQKFIRLLRDNEANTAVEYAVMITMLLGSLTMAIRMSGCRADALFDTASDNLRRVNEVVRES